MRIDIVTLFPELFADFVRLSFVGRSVAGGQAEIRLRQLRDFGLGKHKNVDDTPFGGGSGMVLRSDVVVPAMEACDAPTRPRRILLTPQGAPFTQAAAARLALEPAILLMCGRYEGFDERVRSHVDEEISLGDFVMTGGEVAAMAIVEAVVRLLPGVLGNAESVVEESHGAQGLLEYPQYTRPVDFRGVLVPEVLASGNHKFIDAWRLEQSIARTQVRRPDMSARRQVFEPAKKAKKTKPDQGKDSA